MRWRVLGNQFVLWKIGNIYCSYLHSALLRGNIQCFYPSGINHKIILLGFTAWNTDNIGTFRVVADAVMQLIRVVLSVPEMISSTPVFRWMTWKDVVAWKTSSCLRSPFWCGLISMISPIFVAQFPSSFCCSNCFNHPCFWLKSLCLSLGSWTPGFLLNFHELPTFLVPSPKGASALCGLSTACFGGLVRDILCRCPRWS